MNVARPILIVEDHPDQRDNLAECLAMDREFVVTVAATLGEAGVLLNIPDARFDAVILDLGMPDGNGHSFCAEVRRQGHKMPILFVSGSCEEANVVRAMEVDANDYVCKPVRLNELRARLSVQLRMFDTSEHATFTIGAYTFRPAAKLLLDPATKRRVRLTDKETAILKFLYQAGPQPVSRHILLDKVWGYNSGMTTHTLETHIYRLRQKLEADPTAFCVLVTVPGGYQLNAGGRAPR
jgi:DNA-binding response OmpR family regulator